MNVKQGDKVVFSGYGDDVKDEDKILVDGETYTVADIGENGDSILIEVANPSYNAKDKKSPKLVQEEVFEGEFEIVKAKGKAVAKPVAKAVAKPASKTKAAPVAEEDDAEDDSEDEAEEEAPKAKAKAAPAKAKTAAKEEAKPAKGKAKTTAKPAAKGKLAKAAKVKEEVKPEQDGDKYSELSEEQEDEDVLSLVNEADDILELAKELSDEVATTEYRLGGVLYHVLKTKAYVEVDEKYAARGGFMLYAEDHLNIGGRKAYNLVDIYYTWRLNGLDPVKVQAIGWTKASKIVAVMNEDNAEELLELAETSTVADLVENIKVNYKEVGGTKGDKKKLVTFKFRLFEDQATGVEEVINAVAAQMGFSRLDEAFEHIIMEWATEHPMEKPKATKAVKAKPAAKAVAKAA